MIEPSSREVLKHYIYILSSSSCFHKTQEMLKTWMVYSLRWHDSVLLSSQISWFLFFQRCDCTFPNKIVFYYCPLWASRLTKLKLPKRESCREGAHFRFKSENEWQPCLLCSTCREEECGVALLCKHNFIRTGWKQNALQHEEYSIS